MKKQRNYHSPNFCENYSLEGVFFFFFFCHKPSPKNRHATSTAYDINKKWLFDVECES